ncbi:MAG: AraC family transcriptional regulator [Gemmatimonadota bacterium]
MRHHTAREIQARPSLTDVARVEMSCGSFDALCAAHFTQRFPPHFHETFAIGVVESGTVLLKTQRGEWIARAGTTLAFSPGEIHSAEQVATDGYSYRMFYPSVELMREIGVDQRSLESGAPLFRAPVIEDSTFGQQFIDAHIPIMGGSRHGRDEDRLIASVRGLVARHANTAVSRRPIRPVDLEVVERARAYLHERIAHNVRLATLADVCGLSPFHMLRVFRRVVGVPPYAYLVQLRVNRAQLLLSEGFPVADVAYTCGFSDQSHLTRTFRRAVGVPPGQYARQVRQRSVA